MPNTGPIVLLEDDPDDKAIMEDVLKELEVENKLVWFTDCDKAIEFLKSTSEQPFLILSDVNLPKLRGTEFKRKLDSDPQLRKKSIPFVFYSTTTNKTDIEEAFTLLTVQGFFKKGDRYEEIKKTVGLIIEYWKHCRHPNSF